MFGMGTSVTSSVKSPESNQRALFRRTLVERTNGSKASGIRLVTEIRRRNARRVSALSQESMWSSFCPLVLVS